MSETVPEMIQSTCIEMLQTKTPIFIIFLNISSKNCVPVPLFYSTDIPFETENDLRIKGTARTPDVLLSTPVGMKVPKRSSTSRKLLLDGNEDHFAKGDVGEGDDEEEYEWKVVCCIDSKVRWEEYGYVRLY